MNQKMRSWIYVYADLLATMLAWIGAYTLRFYGPLPVPRGIPYWLDYAKLAPFLYLAWIVSFYLLGVYKTHNSRFSELWIVLRSSALLVGLFFLIAFFYREYHYSRLMLVMFCALHPTLVWSLRRFIDMMIARYIKAMPPRRILLVGDQNHVSSLPPFETHSTWLGVVPLGGSLSSRSSSSLKVFPYPESWDHFFTENRCDAVIFLGPLSRLEQHVHDIKAVSKHVVDVRLWPDMSAFRDLALGYEKVPDSDHFWMSLHESPLRGAHVVHKRIFDILGASACLVLFSPVLLSLILLVKLTSRGPIFYSQERMGLDGKVFSIFKFRSMSVHAEAKSGPVWAQQADQRVTRLGKFMRQTSLDELPQFWNVLRGDMSLVGPRPERPFFVDQFKHQIPHYMLRHKVKAGITGWAQVNGWRGDTSLERRIECDIYYIKHWSLFLDIKILFLTVFKGFRHPNAY